MYGNVCRSDQPRVLSLYIPIIVKFNNQTVERLMCRTMPTVCDLVWAAFRISYQDVFQHGYYKSLSLDTTPSHQHPPPLTRNNLTPAAVIVTSPVRYSKYTLSKKFTYRTSAHDLYTPQPLCHVYRDVLQLNMQSILNDMYKSHLGTTRDWAVCCRLLSTVAWVASMAVQVIMDADNVSVGVVQNTHRGKTLW
jgi:hypothetical protein